MAPIPAFWAAVSLVVGMLAGFWCSAFVAISIFVVFGVLSLTLRLKGLFLLAIAAIIGVVDVALQRVEVPGAITYGKEQRYIGAVVDVDEKDNVTNLIVQIDSVDGESVRREKIAVTLLHDSVFSVDPLPGQNIVLKGVANNPSNKLLLPDERDFDRENMKRGIVASVLSSDRRATVSGDAPDLMNRFRRWRNSLIEGIRYADFATSTTAFLVACLAGDDTLISPVDRDQIATAGLAHLLALSGTHVAILTVLIGFILLPLRLFGNRHTTTWITVVILWIFAFMTGLSPSVVRAVTMASVLVIARILERAVSPFQSLSVAAIVILIFDPYALFSIGFQISFAAVWGIIAVGKLLQQRRNLKKNILLRVAFSYLAMTVSATFATAPLVAYYFHIFPLWFIPSNVVAAIVLPLLLGSGIVCTLCYLFFSNSLFPGIVDFFYDIISSLSELVASSSMATIDSIYPPIMVVGLFYVAMVVGTVVAISSSRPQVPTAVTLIVLFFSFMLCMTLRPVVPQREWYLHGVFTGTALIVTEDDNVWLITDCQTAVEEEHLRKRLTPRLRDFLGRRNIDSLNVMPPRYCSPLIDRKNGSINIGGTSFLFVDDGTACPVGNTDVEYIVITKGVRNNVDSIIARFRPANIVFSASLNSKICNRLQDDLHYSGYETMSLRDTIIQSIKAPSESSSR